MDFDACGGVLGLMQSGQSIRGAERCSRLPQRSLAAIARGLVVVGSLGWLVAAGVEPAVAARPAAHPSTASRVSQAWRAESLLPYNPLPEFSYLENQGEAIAEEAARLAQSQLFEPALARAQVAAYLAPKSAPIQRLLGGLYLQGNQLDRGVAALEQARRLAPNDEAVMFVLGSAYAQQKRYAESIALLQAALQRNPREASGRFDLGNVYLVQTKLDEAIDQYERAIETRPEFWEAINNLGLARYEQGQADLALRHWTAAVALAPKATEPNLAIAAATYTQAGCQADRPVQIGDRCAESLQRARAALAEDDRYANVQFLRDNLWGGRLVTAVERLFLGLSAQRDR